MEITVSLALSSIIFGQLVTFYSAGITSFRKLSDQIDIHYSARTALQFMCEDMRGVVGLEILAAGEQLRIQTQGGETIRYYCNNKQLYRETIKSNGTVRTPVAENIVAVHFVKDSGLLMIDVYSARNSENFRLSTSACIRSS